MRTICGIDLMACARKPTPEELGAIVARWSAHKAAAFLAAWGEQVRFTNNPPKDHWDRLANEIKATEETFCDGSASQLIDELHQRLFDKAAAP